MSKIWSYIVQEKFGKTLDCYLEEHNDAFSEKTTIQIGLQLVEILQEVHECGYIQNDLKPDNILVGDHDNKSLHKLRLIDFGISRKYQDDNGQHIKQVKETLFKGNLIFASVNALNYDTLSRRDDLISLCYVLVYLMDDDLPFMRI